MQLKKISVMPLAKITTVIYALLGFLLGIIAAIVSVTGQDEEGFWSLGVWSLIVFPLVNAVAGFLMGVFFSGTYNLFSKWFGGIEVELEEV